MDPLDQVERSTLEAVYASALQSWGRGQMVMSESDADADATRNAFENEAQLADYMINRANGSPVVLQFAADLLTGLHSRDVLRLHRGFGR
jgi:hypothetical protein